MNWEIAWRIWDVSGSGWLTSGGLVVWPPVMIETPGWDEPLPAGAEAAVAGSSAALTEALAGSGAELPEATDEMTEGMGAADEDGLAEGVGVVVEAGALLAVDGEPTLEELAANAEVEV